MVEKNVQAEMKILPEQGFPSSVTEPKLGPVMLPYTKED